MRIYVIILIGVGILSCDGANSNQNNSLENTSVIIEPSFDKKNAFLTRPEILNSSRQSDLFAQLEGLWHFEKIEHIKDKKSTIKNEDLYFIDGMAWSLFYPCCAPYTSYAERVYLTEDSIFFSTDGYAYLNENEYCIKFDTLMIFGTSENGRNSWIEYYIRKEYDQVIVDSLYVNGFNKECLAGNWNLVDIHDYRFDNYSLEDDSFSYVPKLIDLSEYQIHGNSISCKNDSAIKFRIVKVNPLTEEYGGKFSISLEDNIPKKEGYSYVYHLK